MNGYRAHLAWERTRTDENECDAERRLSDSAEQRGADMKQWWSGWFERSDEWRDEIDLKINDKGNGHDR